MKKYFLWVLTATFFIFNCSANNKPFLHQTDIFISGTDGYHTYRIPAIIATKKGTILAFCEGRKGGQSDSGDIDLVLKRSTNGGKSWSRLMIVWDDGNNTCGNPCAVADRKTGEVFLLMTHNFGSDREPKIIDQTGRGTRTVRLTKSADDGLTWSKPVNITQSVKQKNWTWYATGPGAGIQLQNGRLIIPCDHIEAETKKYYSHIIYSDDHGQTWQPGGSTPTDKVNECEVVELSDGTLYLSMRNYDRSKKARAYATSTDGGLSWSAFGHDTTLIEPICQASIRSYTPVDSIRQKLILFSNPASKEKREKMTVRLSFDDCRSWPIARTIYPGPAAYSCLIVLPDKSIACFYERGKENPYEKITLARFNLPWLLEEK